MQTRRRFYALALAVSAVAGSASFASAAWHLRLVKSEPAKDAVVAAPKQLDLWFSLKPAMTITSVKLTSSSDAAVKLGKPSHDGDVKSPVTVTVDEALAAGTYTVSWKTASSDMHPQTGDYTFTVK